MTNYFTPLTRLVIQELPKDYSLSEDDFTWLKFVNKFWDEDKPDAWDNILKSVQLAIKEAKEKGKTDFLIDPYELFIDANLISIDEI